ncbi:class I SAM-dependent methyltransferase family protein [Planosporangium sp. 12N6]|uniref:class I SAM-dependent methyltransferase family protein n=1 Tax=Planosporangium spinosum TaxID=3402278 RepID=UPI003CF75001
MTEATGKRDWYGWHDGYDTPGSTLARRLAAVRARIAEALDTSPPGPLRVVSLCAGQGRDLLDVLAGHPRRDDVTALLVELDPRNAAIARRTAEAAGLRSVEIRVGDASLTDQYADAVPADLVLMCGIFGNISDADIRATVGYASQLCATGGTVIWTRHRRPPDLVPRLCDWFAEHGFAREWLSGPDEGFGVGVHRFTDHPRPLESGARMFTFVPREPR